MSASPKPNWRGNAGAAAPGRGGVRSWRRPGTAAGWFLPARGQFARWLFSAVASLVSVLAMIVFVWLVFAPGCTATRFGVLTVSDYNDRSLPPLSFAKEDADLFLQSVQKQGGKGVSLEGQIPDPSAEVRRSLTSGGAKNVVVLWLATLSGRTSDGVLLYQERSHPDEPETALPLDRVFKFLKGLPPRQKKLLILDVARGPTDWRWGQFGSPFSTPDPEELTKAVEDVPNLAILTAAAPGEISWSSPQLKNSVFAEQVARGLLGEADRVQKSRDDRVTLQELFEFAREGTNHWVVQNRDLRGQHPRLILPKPEAAAKELLATVVGRVSGKPAIKATTTKATSTSDALADLNQLWAKRDRLKETASPEQVDPLAWRGLHEQLRRAERQYLAGQPNGVSEFKAQAEELLERLQRRADSPAVKVNEYPFVAESIKRAATEGNYSPPKTDPPLPDDHLQQVLTPRADGSLIPAKTSPDLVKQAVQMRRLAERLAWRNFRPRVWAGELLTAADQDRRRGEDWLFVDPAHAARSEAAFKATDDKLKQFEEWTRELTLSRQLLNRLWSELPELAYWAANRFPLEDSAGRGSGPEAKGSRSPRQQLMTRYAAGIDKERFSPPAGDELRQIVKDLDAELPRAEADLLALFGHTRHLTRLLDAELDLSISRDGSGLVAAKPELLKELSQLREEIQNRDRGLTAVQSRLEKHAETLLSGTTSDAGQYLQWQKLHGALQWTGLNASLRDRLLREWELTDKLLHQKRENAANGKGNKVAETQEEEAASFDSATSAISAQRQGQWQALWALQVISLGLPTDLGSSSDDRVLGQEQQKRWVDWKTSLIDEQNRASLLVSLGNSVRGEFQSRRQRVSVPAEKGESLARSLQLLWRAERAARTLHGYDALLISEKDDPVRGCRKLEWATLCLWQAERYADDFWGKQREKDAGEAWFEVAARQCVEAARRINSELPQPGFVAALTRTEETLKLRKSGSLKLVQKENSLALGLNGEQPTSLSAEKSDGVPPGLAALWLDLAPDEATRLEILPAARRAIFDESASAEFTIRRGSNSANSGSNCDPVPVRPRLLFRGRLWNSNDILVSPCPPQGVEIVWRAVPNTGEIVVQGVDRREMVFILDCSHSMNALTTDAMGNSRSRMSVAKGVLRRTLERMQGADPPHTIGVIAYGHRVKKLEGQKIEINEDWKKRWPFDPIIESNPQLDYEWLSKGERPQPFINIIQDPVLKEKFEALVQWGNTPLLGAIKFAAKPLVNRKAGGLIVAITDGGWTDTNEERSTVELLKDHPEIALHLVVFGDVTPDEDRNLTRLAKDVKAQKTDARNGGNLDQVLIKAMKPREYRIASVDSGNREVLQFPLRKPEEESTEIDLDRYRLKFGRYRVSFPDCPETPVDLVGGERLMFDLDLASRRLKHRKPSLQLSRPATGVPADATDEPTRFGYVKAHYDKTKKHAEFVFALDRDDDLGFVRRPAEVFIEVQPQGVRQELSRTIQLEPNQSVPIWRIGIEQWPGNAMPEVQAFWKMTRSEPDQRAPLVKLLAEPQTISIAEQKWQLSAKADGKQIRVEVANVRMPNASENRRESLSDLRVELGVPGLDQKFEPASGNVRAQFFEKDGRIDFTFTVGDNFPLDRAVVAITTRATCKQGSRQIDKPLAIAKWDTEQ